MTAVSKVSWSEISSDQMTAGITRQFVWGKELMVARLVLDEGAIVPPHQHDNEQVSYVLSGRLRFWLGRHADDPEDVYLEVGPGEMIVIPGGVRHRALALEATEDLEIFSPPRQDWIERTEAYLGRGK